MLFKQVYDYLLERIQRGEWSEDEKLPSVRSLSAELHVHRLTVFKAYQMLKNNNKVYVKDKQGYYIQTGAVMPFHSLQDPIVLASVQGSSLSEIHDVKVDYQFSKALLDPNLLPNHYFAEYAKKVFDLYPKVLGTYSTIQGDQELREALTRYFTEKYRFYITADELLVTSGSQQAIDLVARALVRSRDIVLVEQPTYSPAIDVFTRLGARMIPVEIHPHGYDLDQVEMLMQQFKPRLFYMNPTFHNPTGYTIPAEQRKRLVELAQTYRCLIMEDDPYRDIYFGEKPPFPLFTYDTAGYVIYIRSFSKYVAPGLGISIAVCRPAVMRELLRAKSISDSGTPLLSQKIFLHYFFSERMQQHLVKLRIALEVRKEIMEEALSDTGWSWESPQGGFNLWIRLPDHVQMEKLLETSIANSITFVPGYIFDSFKGFRSWIRLSYAYLNEQQLREGMRRFISLVPAPSGLLEASQ